MIANNRVGEEVFAKSSIKFYGGSFISGQHGQVLAQVRALVLLLPPLSCVGPWSAGEAAFSCGLGWAGAGTWDVGFSEVYQLHAGQSEGIQFPCLYVKEPGRVVQCANAMCCGYCWCWCCRLVSSRRSCSTATCTPHHHLWRAL